MIIVKPTISGSRRRGTLFESSEQPQNGVWRRPDVEVRSTRAFVADVIFMIVGGEHYGSAERNLVVVCGRPKMG